MENSKVLAIFICHNAGLPMIQMDCVNAIEGLGLEGDRYATGIGSFNNGKSGKRQVTLINSTFFEGTGFNFEDSRRNIVTSGVELMWLIGREFQIGEARMIGVKYCDPCNRVSKLAGKENFKEKFSDRGGLIADVIRGGVIRVGSLIIGPNRGY